MGLNNKINKDVSRKISKDFKVTELEEDKWSDTEGLSIFLDEARRERAQLPDADLVMAELSNLYQPPSQLEKVSARGNGLSLNDACQGKISTI